MLTENHPQTQRFPRISLSPERVLNVEFLLLHEEAVFLFGLAEKS